MIHHKSVLADLLTPVSAFLRVAGKSERAFLLESVEGGEKIGRFSFIGVDPESSYRGTFTDFRRSFPEIRSPHLRHGGRIGTPSRRVVGSPERTLGSDGLLPNDPGF